MRDDDAISMEVKITLLWEGELMPRNDLCFCKSGKKVKHCHPNINEESVIAHLLASYAKIDEQNKNAKTLCKKGCATCCFDNFQVMLWEYLAILNYLGLGLGRNRELLANLREESVVNNGACFFLIQKDNSCKIYEVRPAICRNYGITRQSMEGGLCKTMEDKGRDYDLIDQVEGTMYLLKYKGRDIASKSKTLHLWLEGIDENDILQPSLMRDLLKTSANGTYTQFVETFVRRGSRITSSEMFVE